MLRSDVLDAEVANGVAAYSSTVTPFAERRSGLYLTKFEVARVIGERAKQIASGAAVSLPTAAAGRDAVETAERCSDPRSLAVDPVMMAKYDLIQRRIPMLVRRTWPDGAVETIPVSELMVDVTMLDLQY
ncbi:DNA-directed RNA polymerase I subunit [Novymonas esmeraldas]|uniref:DNA-directed RNA polymerase I subunit n=1 Tax=Novymonas esmeraldas TaxID=1808958 RepID=A0AAW0F5J0_9TRYP